MATSTGPSYEFGSGQRFTPNELELLGLSEDEPYTRIEFDNSGTISYGLCMSFALSFAGCWWPIWIFFCPCIWCSLNGMATSRLGAITHKQIVYKSMIYGCVCCCENVTTKTVPLSKITDLSIHQGCCQRCFGINQMNVETASSPAPEIVLVAAKHAYQIRQMVLKMRDGNQDNGGNGGGGGLSSAATASLMANNQLSQQTYALDTQRNSTLNEIRDVLVSVRNELSNLGAINNNNNGPGDGPGQGGPRYAPMYNAGNTNPAYM